MRKLMGRVTMWSEYAAVALSVLVVIPFIFASNPSGIKLASASHANIPIDGVVGTTGCKTIGGELVSDTIDYVEPARSIDLCKYREKYHFKIVEYSACPAMISYRFDVRPE